MLHLAVLPTFAATWLIPRLPAFFASHADLSIDLASALHSVDFDESPYDAAIQRAVMARKDTDIMHLLDEKLIMVASPGLTTGSVAACDVDPCGLDLYIFIQCVQRFVSPDPRLLKAAERHGQVVAIVTIDIDKPRANAL